MHINELIDRNKNVTWLKFRDFKIPQKSISLKHLAAGTRGEGDSELFEGRWVRRMKKYNIIQFLRFNQIYISSEKL